MHTLLSESCGWWERGRRMDAQWTSEGNQNRVKPAVCAPEQALRNEMPAYVSTHRVGAFAPSRVAPQEYYILSQLVKSLGQFFCPE